MTVETSPATENQIPKTRAQLAAETFIGIAQEADIHIIDSVYYSHDCNKSLDEIFVVLNTPRAKRIPSSNTPAALESRKLIFVRGKTRRVVNEDIDNPINFTSISLPEIEEYKFKELTEGATRIPFNPQM